MDLEKLKYPIGRFQVEYKIDKAAIDKFINEIELLPERLADAVRGLNLQQLQTQYRPEGWTIQQVVNHIADSHLNAYVRFKLTLTETKPIVKPYDEKLWAELPDAKLIDINVSIAFIDFLHKRWVILLKQLKTKEFDREFLHPESGMKNLKETLCLYAWHSNHHLAHITSLKQRMNW